VKVSGCAPRPAKKETRSCQPVGWQVVHRKKWRKEAPCSPCPRPAPGSRAPQSPCRRQAASWPDDAVPSEGAAAGALQKEGGRTLFSLPSFRPPCCFMQRPAVMRPLFPLRPPTSPLHPPPLLLLLRHQSSLPLLRSCNTLCYENPN
jgi:hypothetical protein